MSGSAVAAGESWSEDVEEPALRVVGSEEHDDATIIPLPTATPPRSYVFAY